jgi:DivIVA domain-containing protein
MLDLMLDPDQIRGTSFTVVTEGYDRAAVDAFLAALADRIEQESAVDWEDASALPSLDAFTTAVNEAGAAVAALMQNEFPRLEARAQEALRRIDDERRAAIEQAYTRAQLIIEDAARRAAQLTAEADTRIDLAVHVQRELLDALDRARHDVASRATPGATEEQ